MKLITRCRRLQRTTRIYPGKWKCKLPRGQQRLVRYTYIIHARGTSNFPATLPVVLVRNEIGARAAVCFAQRNFGKPMELPRRVASRWFVCTAHATNFLWNVRNSGNSQSIFPWRAVFRGENRNLSKGMILVRELFCQRGAEGRREATECCSRTHAFHLLSDLISPKYCRLSSSAPSTVQLNARPNFNYSITGRN